MKGGRLVSRQEGLQSQLGDGDIYRGPNVGQGGQQLTIGSGEIAGVGLEILILDDDGRIRIDYQFIEA
jgi:hypothetical protein